MKAATFSNPPQLIQSLPSPSCTATRHTMTALVNSGEEETLVPGPVLTHWVNTRQLPGDLILKHLSWKDAVRLGFSSPELWPHVERLVALARPDRVAAFADLTPNRLRIPLLTGLTAADAREYDNGALLMACGGGHLATAQWLVERFGLTAADARAQNNGTLWWACHFGHLEVAQWLTERFGLTAADARAQNNWALRAACGHGRLAMAQWLVERFGLTAADARAEHNDALRTACAHGHLATAQWLVERFGLTADDARANNNCALRWACYYGQLPTVRWLATVFNITREEIHGQ